MASAISRAAQAAYSCHAVDRRPGAVAAFLPLAFAAGEVGRRAGAAGPANGIRFLPASRTLSIHRNRSLPGAAACVVLETGPERCAARGWAAAHPWRSAGVERDCRLLPYLYVVDQRGDRASAPDIAHPIACIGHASRPGV